MSKRGKPGPISREKLLAADQALAWEDEQFDPGAWFSVPDFEARDVDPAECDRPVLFHRTPALTQPIRGLLSAARQLLVAEGIRTRAQLHEAFVAGLDALEACELDGRSAREALSAREQAAVIYESVRSGLMHLEVQDEAGALETLANSSELITSWAVRGVEAAARALEQRRAQPRRAAKENRPGARSPLKARIQILMKRERQDGTAFKIFLDRWVRDQTLDDLSISEIDKGTLYEVGDDRDPTCPPAQYTYSALQTYYSKAI